MYYVGKFILALLLVLSSTFSSCVTTSSRVHVSRSDVMQQDGDSRDQLLYIKNQFANTGNPLVYEIKPDLQDLFPRRFLFRKLTDKSDTEMLLQDKWIIVSSDVSNGIVKWKSGMRPEKFEVEGWVLIEKSTESNKEEIIGVALDYGPVFFVGDY